MSLDITRQAAALIDHIQTRFHDGHRRAIPELLTMAAVVEARGIDEGLSDELRVIGNALEQHMFKEEMRLFPMMEQGGNTLIERLIEDLHREHVDYETAMNELRARLRSLGRTHRPVAALQQLVHAVDDLASELGQHIRAQDEDLFPLFARSASPESPSTSNPWSPATTTS